MPTWRETLSVNWTDPTRQVNDSLLGLAQPNGLHTRPALGTSIANDNQLLPWVGQPNTVAQGGTLPNNYDFSFIRQTPQLFSDAVGYDTIMSLFLAGGAGIDPVWSVSWEDDLIMTGVRSFDVKAYDNSFAGYADLGWADDLRLYLPYTTPPAVPSWPHLDASVHCLAPHCHGPDQPHAFDDGARGPHAPFDHRLAVGCRPQRICRYPYTAYNNYNGNIGDDTAGVVRMRRIWDTWSTEYTQAPATGVAPPITVGGVLVSTGFQIGPQTGYAPATRRRPRRHSIRRIPRLTRRPCGGSRSRSGSPTPQTNA